jgi:hypothetical protein
MSGRENTTSPEVSQSFQRLFNYCQGESWRGFDPYDGLNAPWVKTLCPSGKLLRVLLIQFFKRSPLNLRKVLGIKREHNPKALGLFLSAVTKLYSLSGCEHYKQLSCRFFDLLLKNRSRSYSGACWGYNFDWQSRAFFLAAFTPTVVATSFIANALVDAYEVYGEERFLNIARSSCDFVLKDLNRTYGKQGFCFSYSPQDRSIIHNANILGARLLSRVAYFTGEEELKRIAADSVDFLISHQNPNGSWYYGPNEQHRWIDNFHTGFVLDCLSDCIHLIPRFDLLPCLNRGLQFYLDNFFLPDGTPKYYHQRVFPIDVHSCAQSIITLTKFSSSGDNVREMRDRVIRWTLSNMQDSRGCFYFQKRRFFTNRIVYMRWSQAWMLKALACVLAAQSETEVKSSWTKKGALVAG